MGRKIPGRKHRGVRDPEKQAAARLDRIKDKINAPPTNPDIQQVSQSLQRLIDLKNRAKSGEFDTKKKKKSKAAVKAPSTEESKTGPSFKQLPNETDRQFLYRVNKMCENVTKEAAFENKYRVEIQRNEKGEVKEVVKRKKDELEVYLKNVRKEQRTKSSKKKSAENDPPKLTKSQKWQKKKREKKEKKVKQADEFHGYKDTVKFGEIVHAPPTLTAPKKIGPIPRQKKLLLSTILRKSDEGSKQAKIVRKAIDKKGKRKDLPNALRRQLDKQQTEIVDAYKSLKAKKHAST